MYEILFEKFTVALPVQKLPAFEGNKLTWTQPVSVIPLIWQNVLTSGGQLQYSIIKYMKRMVCNCMRFFHPFYRPRRPLGRVEV
jgi:hypothetical protein